MRSTARHRQGREIAVIAASVGAGAALLLAGATVHASLASAGDVAVARLSAVVADTVVAEWERMLRASDPPVAPAGEAFRWSADDVELVSFERSAGSEGGDPDPVGESSVFRTLLREAEHREVEQGDRAGALDLVLEALVKDPENAERAEAQLSALQLGARLGRADVVAAAWTELRACAVEHSRDGIPLRWLAWMALPGAPLGVPPDALRSATPAASIASAEELERLALRDDRIALGAKDEPHAHFELAPLVPAVCARMGLALPALERRRVRALASLGELPEVLDDGLWHVETFAERPFVVRRTGDEVVGSFFVPRALEDALTEGSAQPTGFRLDFDGDRDELGPAVRPRTSLPGSALAFTLRHEDPARLGRAESSRLRLLRGALFALALACIGGGFLTARVLARERKLGELRSSFVAGVSHDLRTPLAAILLLAENLQAGVVGEADRERYHRALRKEATRLRRLVDEVLDFSRLERGEALRLQREEVALARFADELAADMRARVEDAGRSFAAELGPLPATAAFDAFALRRAVENLVDNALKHGAGAVRLALAVDAQRLGVRVTDEGTGVPAAERERVFEPFARLAGANGHVGGTGLGLAIVRAIARAHGGEARVASDAGAGAVFELELPLEEEVT